MEKILQNLELREPHCVATTGDFCGEGVLWHRASRCIYWTDINRFLVHRLLVADGSVKTWYFAEPVTCVLETSREDTLALSLGSGIALWKPDGDPVMLFHLPGSPLVRCNDAAVDPCGVLWVGSMRNNVARDGSATAAGGRDGVLYRVDSTGAGTAFRRDLGISNTLVWSPDKTKFYFGDSEQNCIWYHDYHSADQSIGAEQPFFKDFARGKPDGSAIDRDGFIWNCRYDGGCIVRIAPDGRIDRVIEMPVSRPTNCTFGGPQGNMLYITSASPQPGRWERFGGCLFAMETNVTGMDENRWQLPG